MVIEFVESDNPQVDLVAAGRELLAKASRVHALNDNDPQLDEDVSWLLESLCNELEQLRFQHSVQAETIMEFQEEQRALIAALRSVPLLVEAAKGILNVHTWRGKKGYEAALRDGIRELQAAVNDVPDVAGMLLSLSSTPKGESQQ